MILVLADYYLPGYRAGGPITTLSGMVERLSDEFSFRVLTRDRDLGEASAYPGVRVGGLTATGEAQVRYLTPAELSPGRMRRILREQRAGVMYLNSFFSPRFSVLPMTLWRAGAAPSLRQVVLAPRGEFSPGALALKAFKKRSYLALARATHLYDGVLWQASSEDEAAHIRAQFPRARVWVAPDLGPVLSRTPPPPRVKQPGELRVVFLSRISPKKNLLGAIQLIAGLEGDVHFDVFGPKEDDAYWRRCERAIQALPPSVRVTVHGPITPPQVPAALGAGHVMLLPTLGENYGHVVLEALRAGCLPLLSDQTPWRGLEARGVGWDVPLGERDGFRRVLTRAMAMTQAEWDAWSERAAAFGEAAAGAPEAERENRALLREALS
jgi:glycosyltransferase involved in cell wall biosynthesis